ncbi:MAG: ribonuclease Y, partial [Deltaproteobacteria bacterium]
MSTIYIIGLIPVSLMGGVLIGFFLRKKIVESRIDAIEKYSKKILAEAQKEAKTIKKEATLQAKDAVYQMKLEFEKETKEKKDRLQNQEKRLFHKEENLERKIDQLEKRESRISEREKFIDRMEKQVKRDRDLAEQLVAEQRKKLEKLAGISPEDAKKLLIDAMQEEARHDAAKLIRRIENEAKAEGTRKAQEILALAVKRYSGDYVAEKTVSVVNLPNDEMKGRIIGRE